MSIRENWVLYLREGINNNPEPSLSSILDKWFIEAFDTHVWIPIYKKQKWGAIPGLYCPTHKTRRTVSSGNPQWSWLDSPTFCSLSCLSIIFHSPGVTIRIWIQRCFPERRKNWWRWFCSREGINANTQRGWWALIISHTDSLCYTLHFLWSGKCN